MLPGAALDRQAALRGPAAAGEWRANWTLVFTAMVGFLFSSMLGSSLSVFMGPIGQDFGWSRTLVSMGISIASITVAVLAPFSGGLIDRFGSRRVALLGTIAAAAAIASMGLANGTRGQWIALWAIYAVLAVAIQAPVWTAAVAGVFTAGRGLALGLTLAGATAAHTIMPPLSNLLIEQFGWRAAFVWMGFGGGAVSLLLSYSFLFDIHDRRRAALADGTAERSGPPDLSGLSVADAWKDSALWRIGLSIFLVMVVSIGLLIHQVEILVEAGVSRANAAGLASLAGAAGIVGKVVTGMLLDRYRGSLVGGMTLGTAAISFAFLIDGTTVPLLIVFAMLVNGYTAGAKLQIASYLTVQHAGMRNFGKIYGAVTSVVALGSAAGPVVAGAIYDWYGGYQPFLLLGAIVSLVAGLLVLTLPAYPNWEKGGATG